MSGSEECEYVLLCVHDGKGMKWFSDPMKGKQGGRLAFMISLRLIKKPVD